MPLSIRTATASDVDAVVDLVTSAYRGEASRAGWTTEADLLDGQRTDAEEVGSAIDDASSVVLLAERDDAVVGCIKVDRGDGGRAHFGMFAVAPNQQSGGIGGALLDAAEGLASDWGCRELALEVLRQRTELQEWYRRRGYQPTGETLPFPYGDERFGRPRRDDLVFEVLSRPL